MHLYCYSLIGGLQHFIIGKSGLNGEGIGTPLKQLLNYSEFVARREVFEAFLVKEIQNEVELPLKSYFAIQPKSKYVPKGAQ